MTVDATLARFATLDEPALARPWAWRDGKIDVRYALYRALESVHEQLVAAAAGPHPESRRILALAQRAFGDLRGALTGVPDTLLDRAPREGEWSIRDTFRHLLTVEHRYLIGTQYALERLDGDPVRVPDDRLPTPAQIDASGDAATLLRRLGDARAESNRRLGDVPAEAMTRPSVWASFPVDVRFRLHRFAAHVIEHTIQCDKTLAALGWRETEGRRIVRRIWAEVGQLEGLGAAVALPDDAISAA